MAGEPPGLREAEAPGTTGAPDHPSDVVAVPLPIWNEKRVTARRVRQRIGAVMRWAVAQGYREDNPAGEAIGAALPKNGVRPQHLAALPYAEVAGALEQVRGSGAYPATVLAFEFLVLTACRSGEVRGALWKEIDLQAREWRIPPERMKTGREHRVPLSTGALAVLREAREFSDGAGPVFPSARGGLLSKLAIAKLVRDLGIGAVPHGFRSSFRDWAAECSDAPREVCELALAHVNTTPSRPPTGAPTCSSGDRRSWSSGPRSSHGATSTKGSDPAPIFRGQFMAGGGRIVPGDAAAQHTGGLDS